MNSTVAVRVNSYGKLSTCARNKPSRPLKKNQYQNSRGPSIKVKYDTLLVCTVFIYSGQFVFDIAVRAFRLDITYDRTGIFRTKLNSKM